MFHTLLPVHGEESEPQLARRLGEYLNLEGPAPLAVLRRALVDDGFMLHLARSRNSPDLLAVLFEDRRNRVYEGAVRPPRAATHAVDVRGAARSAREPVQQPGGHSAAGLLRSSAKAALRFASSGFETVSDEALDARLAACRACPALADPPDRLLYKVQLGPRSDPRICSACGCPVARKARLASERCPREDPARPGFDRWGIPLVTDRSPA